MQHAHFLELGVIRTFDFVSALRRMSVIVKRLRSSSMEIYVKGAPEVMEDICDKDSCAHLRLPAGLYLLTHDYIDSSPGLRRFTVVLHEEWLQGHCDCWKEHRRVIVA